MITSMLQQPIIPSNVSLYLPSEEGSFLEIPHEPPEIITEHTFTRYALAHYTNINCDDVSEFEDDVQRFKYLKRLFNKYQDTKELKERLILNHLIVLYNVFDTHATTKMLFVKLKGYESYLKTFLVFLSYMPEQIDNLNGGTIYSSDIQMDQQIIDKLRQIK